jgi:hypothetical protein
VRFFLGTHELSWFGKTDVPLFVSRTRFARRRSLPSALGTWALDSGGFTALGKPPHRWTLDADEYVEIVARLRGVGRMAWAAPQDWMCEPEIVAATGLSVREHQERTVSNFLELRGRGPFIPVLQGYTYTDYERCLGLYASAGVDLRREALVGVGTVCRRQATDEIGEIIAGLAAEGLRLHGFGVKKQGVARYGHLLASADSTAWSLNARRDKPLPGCSHRNCANCIRYAQRWRFQLVSAL